MSVATIGKQRAYSALSAGEIKALVTPGAQERRNKSLLLYIHVPFCSSKCHFCDWVVGYDTRDLIDRGGDLREAYVEALCKQIDTYAPMLSELGYRSTNIYWGGGTPTRLYPEQIVRVIQRLARYLPMNGVREHTAECSPETLTPQHLDAWMANGLNRLSIGVQAFDAPTLRRIGRSHSVDEVYNSIRYVREAGLENFNIDLVTGLPQQSAEAARASVQIAIDADIPHISLYMFRDHAEALTAVRQMNSGHIQQRSKEDRTRSYYEAKSMLESAGYEEYIVGYFAKEVKYRFDSEDYYFSIRGDYFGFGAGAGSVIGRCSLKSGEASRYGNSHVRNFISHPTELFAFPLRHAPDALFTDGFFKAFATPDGIDRVRWLDQFGFAFDRLMEARPGIRNWLNERRAGGAVFEETSERFALSDKTRIATMIWRS